LESIEGDEARPPPLVESVTRSTGCAAWLLLSFHTFGYKVIHLEEVAENKAMREEEEEEGVYSA